MCGAELCDFKVNWCIEPVLELLLAWPFNMRDSPYKHSHSTTSIKRMYWDVFSATTNSSFSPPLLFLIMKHISEESYNNLVSLLDTGLSSHNIEAQLGLSRSTIDIVRVKTR